MLAARYPALRAVIEQAGHGGSWKTTTWLARCLGFLLGLLAAGLLGGVLRPLPSPWLIGGLLLILAAEWLAAQRRVLRSGIEEALYLCGAVAVVTQIILWNRGGQHEEIAVAMIATAVLLVGWRLLNPLFTTLAAAGYSLAISLIDWHPFGGRSNALAAAACCAALAVAALVAGHREWQRPSHDRMLDGLVIVMPWLAHGWLQAYSSRQDASEIDGTALLVAMAFLVVNLAVGIRRRARAPLIGALGNLACVAQASHAWLPWPMHWKLIAAGSLLLTAAALLERRLRDRSAGISSQPLDEPPGLDLLQMAGAAQVTPAPGTAPSPGVQGQGGSFGGGGASGRF